ncbi:heme-binding protein [Dokdonella sp.]|uniref:heme-binding protein n=1 Tax=Dokdonella sp. TaxID=2291710 RepID=UPI0025BC1CBB|nr:heme-binding protein [Dokdonella sp.]MBX3693112.1 heme-binding protein [Dokdonella sp.]MCW5566935.1 heme-binding protein [Dokdonella sp.]
MRFGALLIGTSLLAACGGGSNTASTDGTSPGPGTGSGDSGCSGSCANASSFLTEDDIRRIIAQAVNEAQGQNLPATITVVDRVGNVLGAYRMTNSRRTQKVDSGRGVIGGLEGLEIPSELTAIAKAITSVYFSSEGNAFTSRTAGQVAQEHFNPGDITAPSGPLFGVQFSQLPCSDISARFNGIGPSAGPHRSPIGIAADPGGVPLYKNGVPVGAIGVSADDTYGVDTFAGDIDRNLDEYIALAGTYGFAAPVDRRADRITAGGLSLRFTDVEFNQLARNPASAPAFATLGPADGQVIAIPAFFSGTISRGLAFGQVESGIRPDPVTFPGLDAFVVDDGSGTNRFPPRAGTDGPAALSAEEVRTLMSEALKVANRTRAQVRKPLGSPAGETIVVVDTNGVVLGLVRSRDALVDAVDVTTQKARTAAFFSGGYAAADLASVPPATYLRGALDLANGRVAFTSAGSRSPFAYVTALRAFLPASGALGDGAIAYSNRAIGNLSRPFYPDGVPGRPPGPLSLPINDWSVFSTGLELDLDYNQAALFLAFYLQQIGLTVSLDGTDLPPLGEAPTNCTGIDRVPNGITLFGGSVPIYRGNTLVGAVGASGDGTDQSDLVAFLGLHNAGVVLGGAIGNAPPAIRADTLVPQGARLLYVQCPQSPFLNSNEQYVCEGK